MPLNLQNLSKCVCVAGWGGGVGHWSLRALHITCNLQLGYPLSLSLFWQMSCLQEFHLAKQSWQRTHDQLAFPSTFEHAESKSQENLSVMVLTSIAYLMFMHIWICMYFCYCSLQTNLEGRHAPSSLLVTSGFLLSYLLPGFWLRYSGSSMTSLLLNPAAASSSLSHLALGRHHLTCWEPLCFKLCPWLPVLVCSGVRCLFWVSAQLIQYW